jgi:putative monooxygenase
MISAVTRSSITPSKNNRGGEMHFLLTSKTVGMETAFVGTLALQPGEVHLKLYHPYSDKSIYILKGEVTFEGDENTVVAVADTAVFVPRLTPHRLRNSGNDEAFLVFFCAPLAPSPEQGHVLLEEPQKALP